MKKISIFCILLAILSLFASCGTTIPIIKNKKGYDYEREVQASTNYEIGKIQKANTGNEMIAAQKIKTVTKHGYIGLHSIYTSTFDFGSSAPDIKKDEFFNVYGTSDKGIIIIGDFEKWYYYGHYYGIEIDKKGHILRGLVHVRKNILPHQGKWPTKQIFQDTTITYKTPSKFKIKMLYQGKSGNNIKILYREFSDDLARASFNQELEYNLDESMNIAFKSFEIEIIRATNSFIEFKVINDGGLDWLPTK